jgi:hypothetical protein
MFCSYFVSASVGLLPPEESPIVVVVVVVVVVVTIVKIIIIIIIIIIISQKQSWGILMQILVSNTVSHQMFFPTFGG